MLSRPQLLRLNQRHYKNASMKIRDSLLMLTRLEAKISELNSKSKYAPK